MPSISRERDSDVVCVKVVKATAAVLTELIKKHKLEKMIPAVLRYNDEGLPVITLNQ